MVGSAGYIYFMQTSVSKLLLGQHRMSWTRSPVKVMSVRASAFCISYHWY